MYGCMYVRMFVRMFVYLLVCFYLSLIVLLNMSVASQRLTGNKHLMQMHFIIHLSNKQAPMVCPNSM